MLHLPVDQAGFPYKLESVLFHACFRKKLEKFQRIRHGIGRQSKRINGTVLDRQAGMCVEDVVLVTICEQHPSKPGLARSRYEFTQHTRLVELKSHASQLNQHARCAGQKQGDPGPFGKTTPDAPDFNHPFHGGDLVNVEVKDGVGSLETATSRFTLSEGRLSVFDDDGSALIIHTNPDAYCDQEDELAPGCAGGSRDACGILVRVE